MDEVKDLFGTGARRVVGDGPGGFLLHSQLTGGEDMDKKWD